MDVKIDVVARKEINFAACHSATKIINAITILNARGISAVLRIYGNPEFIFEYKTKMEIDADKTVLEDIALTVNDELYRSEVLEARDAVLNVELLDSNNLDRIITFEQIPVRLQPYLHWERTDMRQLACFLQPNDPLVSKVVSRAGELAQQESGIMGGYLNDPKAQARWIYQALQEVKIHYNLPASGWEVTGQKLRIPHMVLHEECSAGTCLDLAVLYASCLEAIRLHPMLFLISGHAFAGVKLVPDGTLEKSETIKMDAVCERLDEELLPVECTLFADYSNSPFEDAVAAGKDHFSNIEKEDFICALDIAKCREEGFMPAYTYTDRPICVVETQKQPVMQVSNRKLTKLERLQNQAMDFSMNNVLLNLPRDKIASFSVDTKMFFDDQYSAAQLFSAFTNGCGLSAEEQMEYLYSIMSEARQIQREKGTGAAWMTLDELHWVPADSENAIVAPLYLCPVSISYNIRGELVFYAEKNETMLNPVLRELLIQDYRMDISALNDVSAGNYDANLELLRSIMENQPDWAVVSGSASILCCSMPAEAIYQGLRAPELAEHPVVKGILDGAMTWNNELGEGENDSGLFAFPVDSSQAKVIRAVGKKRAQVVFGPAGNGKSQTITNIIIQQILAGKHVLFVAEKPSAQEVIYERLKEVKLDPFALMLPDGKHRLSELAQKVDAALAAVASYKADIPPVGKLVQDRSVLAHFLKEYHRLLTDDSQGPDLESLLLDAETYRDVPVLFENVKQEVDAKENAEQCIRDYCEAVSNISAENLAYFPYLKALEVSDAYREKLALEIDQLIALENNLEVAEKRCATIMGIIPIDFGKNEKRDRTILYAKELLRCPVVGTDIVDPDELLRQKKISAIVREMGMINSVSARYDELTTELNNLKFAPKDSFAGVESPALFEAHNIPVYPAWDGTYSHDQKKRIAKAQEFETYQKALSSYLDGRPERERAAVIRLSFRIARGEGADALDSLRSFINIWDEYRRVEEIVSQKALQKLPEFYTAHPNDTIMTLCHRWLALNEDYQQTNAYANALREGMQAGLAGTMAMCKEYICDAGISTETVVAALRKQKLKNAIAEKISRVEGLTEFLEVGLGSSADDYAELDSKLREIYRKIVLDQVIASMPTISEGVYNNPGLGILQRLIRHSNKDNSIRTVFENSCDAMQQIFPVMIMGPASVAEYIPNDVTKFDLVIFDEASQLPTYKALVPLSRAERCVIVGDEKQLTPTSFFEKNRVDENGITVKSESILEDAIITSMPQNMLKYHYRSKHESLIAFSNAYYYNGDIVSFPSVTTKREGVHYIHVDGVYDRGGSRTNQAEAAAVMDLLSEIFTSMSPDESKTLGIITFNISQMRLIRNLLADAIRGMPQYAQRLTEMVDVVNLESCQGREWDITILSPAYGFDAEGNFAANLGPFSRDEGRNRLNVLITRSREQLYVVTSLSPEMFGEDVSGALRDLRDFLCYMRGDLELDSRSATESKSVAKSALIDIVAQELMNRGYTVHTRIGCSACKVDIGVVDDTGEAYCLGIMLDGERNENLLDREVVIPNVLKTKNWRIYRLHDVSWYSNADKELANIMQLINR